MIFNDKPNCQVSRILINPRPIYVKRSENDSVAVYFFYKILVFVKSSHTKQYFYFNFCVEKMV
jgi:hypothetical protein